VHLLVSLPLSFVVNLVVARHLGAADFGRLATLSLAVDITNAVVSLGVGGALVQFGAKAHSAGRRDEVRALLSGAQGYQLLVQLPLVLVVVLLLARAAGAPSTLVGWMIVFGVICPAATSAAAGCFGIENRGDLGARLALAGSVVAGATSLVVLALDGTMVVLWATRLCVAGVLPAAALWLVAPDYRRAVLRPRLPRLPREFWRFALPTGLAGLLGMAVSSRIEVFALSWWSMAEAAGIYALAFGLVAHVFAPAQALTGPLQPAVAALREVSGERARAAFQRTIRATSVVAGLLVAGVVPPLACLIPVLYGDAYAAATPILVALGVTGGVVVLNGPLVVFAQSRLAGRLVLIATALALAADLVLAVVLVPRWSTWGAVAATTAGVLVQCAVVAAAERAEFGLSRWAVARLVAPLVFAAPMAVLAVWVSLAVSHAVVGACLSALVGAMGWAAAVRTARVGLSGADVRAMVDALPTRLRRTAGWCLARLTSPEQTAPQP